MRADLQELRAAGVRPFDLLCYMVEQGEAQYHEDLAAIRERLRWEDAAERRRVEVARAAASRRAQDERRAAARDRERGVVPGPVLEYGPQPVYEPFREVVYTPVQSWAPGPDWEGWAQPAAPAPVRRGRRRRAPLSTAGLVVRLIAGGTAAYLFVGGLILGMVR